MSDIASIDSAQHRLESTLEFKHYEVNTDLHIQRELLNNKYEDSELKDVKNFAIKSEILDITEQPEEADLQASIPIIINKVNESVEEGTFDDVSNTNKTSGDEDPVVDKDRKACEAIKQERKDLSETPLIDRYRSNGLPFNKEIRVVVQDVMLTLGKQNIQDSVEEAANSDVSYIKAQSVKNKEKKNTHPRRAVRTSTVNGNIDCTHYDAESSKNVFICDICNKSFQKKKSLYQHIHGHFYVFKCTYCSYTARDKWMLNNHINARHTKNIVYNCSFCSYRGYDRNYLRKHENSQHTKSTVYNCSFCDYKIFDKASINRHINAIHTKINVFYCSYCKYKTYDKSTLPAHINTNHTKSTVFNCSFCSYRAYNKSTLNVHMNSKHTMDSVYSCSDCSFRTYNKSSLSLHVNSKHTKKTVYNCSYCDYKSYCKATLNRHINVIHTKFIVFNCCYCNYKTYAKRNLTNHINCKHTKNNVFKCNQCSYETHYKYCLHKHINAKHSH